MNIKKMAKLNSKANIFGISFLRSSASEVIRYHEKIWPSLILSHIIANKARDIHEKESMKTSVFGKR